MAVAGPGAGAAAAAVEEQTDSTAPACCWLPATRRLKSSRSSVPLTGLGLKEAKDLVDGAPKPVEGRHCQGRTPKRSRSRLEDAGAKVRSQVIRVLLPCGWWSCHQPFLCFVHQFTNGSLIITQEKQPTGKRKPGFSVPLDGKPIAFALFVIFCCTAAGPLSTDFILTELP